MTQLLERILPTVQKPSRYIGGEYNEVRDFTGDKDFLAVEAAFSKNVKLEENGEYRS